FLLLGRSWVCSFCLFVFAVSVWLVFFFFFFFNDTATTEIYTLSLHDALPISHHFISVARRFCASENVCDKRSEEHTSELQSLTNLVCRLLLEKKKKSHEYTRRPRARAGHDLPPSTLMSA